MCKIYTTHDDQYGRMRVFERAGRSFGVCVALMGHVPFLEIIDREPPPGEGLRKPRDDARGIAPDLDDALDLPPCGWEDSIYRTLCDRLTLDPDHRRPRYAAPVFEKVAVSLHAIIDWDRNRGDGAAPELQYRLFKTLDMLVKGTPLKPGPSWPVQFLPSKFGRGLKSYILEGWGRTDCEPDGWSNSSYGHLGGIARDFDTPTTWSGTVRRHLVAQGVLLLSKKVADHYLASEEGAYWRTAQREPRQKRSFFGRYFDRLFRTPPSLADAAMITRHFALLALEQEKPREQIGPGAEIAPEGPDLGPGDRSEQDHGNSPPRASGIKI